jgi:hypothetical protein
VRIERSVVLRNVVILLKIDMGVRGKEYSRAILAADGPSALFSVSFTSVHVSHTGIDQLETIIQDCKYQSICERYLVTFRKYSESHRPKDDSP